MNILIEKFTNEMIENGTINVDDKAMYIYGLTQGISIIINILTIILLGTVFNIIWQLIVFMLAYIPLRSFAGGIHAKTQIRCYLYSLILIIGVIFVAKYITWAISIVFCMTAISTLIIYIFAPIEDKNKPLDLLEIAVYKGRTRKVLLIELCFIFGLQGLGDRLYIQYIVLALIVVSLMLLLGIMRNVKIEKLS